MVLDKPIWKAATIQRGEEEAQEGRCKVEPEGRHEVEPRGVARDEGLNRPLQKVLFLGNMAEANIVLEMMPMPDRITSLQSSDARPHHWTAG